MNEIIKNFVAWTKLKVRIHLSEKEIYFKTRDIWWVSLGVNVGHEQGGKNETFERPVLVFKKFNQHVFWAIPLSSKVKDGPFYYEYSFRDQKFCACLTQLRLISSKRLLRKLGSFAETDFVKLKDKVRKLI